MSDGQNAGATTGEMRAVRGEVAAVQAALIEFRTEVQSALTRLTDAITNLVRLEERQTAQHTELARVIKQIEQHEGRIHAVELQIVRGDIEGDVNTQARRNVERLSFTLAGTVGGAGLLFLIQRLLG